MRTYTKYRVVIVPWERDAVFVESRAREQPCLGPKEQLEILSHKQQTDSESTLSRSSADLRAGLIFINGGV